MKKVNIYEITIRDNSDKKEVTKTVVAQTIRDAVEAIAPIEWNKEISDYKPKYYNPDDITNIKLIQEDVCVQKYINMILKIIKNICNMCHI